VSEHASARPYAPAPSPADGAPISAAEQIRSLIRDVPNFPKPGILFRDITPLLANADGFNATIQLLADDIAKWHVDGLVAIESRGFIFGAALAQHLYLPLQLVRKPGKLPWRKEAVDYALEYGTDRIEMHADAIKPGARYAIVDDVLATGGTAAAAATLVRQLGGLPVGLSVLIELGFLDGRARLQAQGAGMAVASIVTY
jgi:adenine phosphoribosyltransferase